MKSSQIKAELEDAGVTQTAIAEKLGFSIAMISSVIGRKRFSREIATAVAHSIERDLLDAFPEYAYR